MHYSILGIVKEFRYIGKQFRSHDVYCKTVMVVNRVGKIISIYPPLPVWGAQQSYLDFVTVHSGSLFTVKRLKDCIHEITMPKKNWIAIYIIIFFITLTLPLIILLTVPPGLGAIFGWEAAIRMGAAPGLFCNLTGLGEDAFITCDDTICGLTTVICDGVWLLTVITPGLTPGCFTDEILALCTIWTFVFWATGWPFDVNNNGWELLTFGVEVWLPTKFSGFTWEFITSCLTKWGIGEDPSLLILSTLTKSLCGVITAFVECISFFTVVFTAGLWTLLVWGMDEEGVELWYKTGLEANGDLANVWGTNLTACNCLFTPSFGFGDTVLFEFMGEFTVPGEAFECIELMPSIWLSFSAVFALPTLLLRVAFSFGNCTFFIWVNEAFVHAIWESLALTWLLLVEELVIAVECSLFVGEAKRDSKEATRALTTLSSVSGSKKVSNGFGSAISLHCKFVDWKTHACGVALWEGIGI